LTHSQPKSDCYHCKTPIIEANPHTIVNNDRGFSVDEPICNGCHDRIKERQAKRKKDEQEGRIKTIIPNKYINIDTYRQELLEDNYGKNLFIFGGTGAGKTVFSCCVAKHLIRKGESVEYISFPKFIMRLQSSFNDKDLNPYDIANQTASNRGCLIIDDLGAEKLTDYVRQIMYFIINEREQQDLQTVITSNFSLPELSEQIDPRISSRIAGMCKVLKFSGKDYRVEPKEESRKSVIREE